MQRIYKGIRCHTVSKKPPILTPHNRGELCFDQADIKESNTPIVVNVSNNQDSNVDTLLGKPIFVHTSSRAVVKPIDLIDIAIKESSSSLTACSYDDDIYLTLFNKAVDEFVHITGNNKINTFLVQIPLKLDRDRTWYDLPDDFHTQSNLFIKKDCCLYTRYQRFNFQPFEAWEENNYYYTYTIQANKLYLKIPEEHLHQACDSCVAPDGTSLTFEYYMSPGEVKSLSEPLYWFPVNRPAKRLMIEILKEVLAEKDGSIYVSPDKAKWFASMLENTNGINSVDSNKRINRNIIRVKTF